MDMQEKYGITGEVMFKSWENKYTQIQKDVKFGNVDPENAFRELKIEIASRIGECVEKYAKRKKLAWILTASAPILFLIGALIASMESDSFFGLALALIGIALPIWGFKSLKSFDKNIAAAVDFDEKYFDGEITYHLKKG